MPRCLSMFTSLLFYIYLYDAIEVYLGLLESAIFRIIYTVVIEIVVKQIDLLIGHLLPELFSCSVNILICAFPSLKVTKKSTLA